MRKILFKIVIFLMFTNNAFSLPWSTDLWEHPSIKPYEEARDYPENSVYKSDEMRELEREEYESIVVGQNRGEASIISGIQPACAITCGCSSSSC